MVHDPIDNEQKPVQYFELKLNTCDIILFENRSFSATKELFVLHMFVVFNLCYSFYKYLLLMFSNFCYPTR